MRKVRQQFACNKGFYDFSVFSFRFSASSGLLAQLGVTFERIVTGIEEQLSRRRARSSMLCVWRARKHRGCRANGAGSPGAGCGYYRYPNGEVLEKPRDAEHAAQMLRNYRVRPIR